MLTKRQRFASLLSRVEIGKVLENLRVPSRLVVLNYHRIGSASPEKGDPGVFSASETLFAEHMSMLKQCFRPIGLDEGLSILASPSKRVRAGDCPILITFDDGYRDNFDLAHPILEQLGMSAVFFVPTGVLDSTEMTWWDKIARCIFLSKNQRVELSFVSGRVVDIERLGPHKAIKQILDSLKHALRADPQPLIDEVLISAGLKETDILIAPQHMNWDQVRELQAYGHAIGGHSVSQRMLARLSDEEQAVEIMVSVKRLNEELPGPVTTMSYPVGTPDAFDDRTRRLAREAGLSAAFSYYGGVNYLPLNDVFNVQRIGVQGQSVDQLRLQLQFAMGFGFFWP